MVYTLCGFYFILVEACHLQIRQILKLCTGQFVTVCIEGEHVSQRIECWEVPQMVPGDVHIAEVDVWAEYADVREFPEKTPPLVTFWYIEFLLYIDANSHTQWITFISIFHFHLLEKEQVAQLPRQ